MRRFLNRSWLCGALALSLLAASTATAQYNYFPGDAVTNDSRTIALAGAAIETLSQDSMTFLLAVPAGVSQFELGVFDGETGGTSGGLQHWDNGSTGLQFALFYDPFQQGSTAPGNLIGVWQGNGTNPTSGGLWTSSGASFPDNGWWNLTVDVPVPPTPSPGEAPSGASFYHLCVSYRAQTGSTITDPCTGDPRPVDTAPQTISNFKLRATANISVLSFAFAYEAALRADAAHQDLNLVYPTYSPPVANNFFVTAPTTYDGRWSFSIDVPSSTDNVVLYGGDFDFGTVQTVGFPSGVTFAACADTDDPDTPNTADFPGFAVGPGNVRLDDSLPEGARVSGSPPDDNRFDVFRRSPCVRWTLTSPGPDGNIATAGDNVVYANNNPSSQREWEQFRVSSEATCDSTLTCNPLVSNCADYCESQRLPPGTWQIDIEGVDLSNLNAWHSDNLSAFCVNCPMMPRPYLIGDTVWSDLNGNGVQDAGEPGIPGVKVELLDADGFLLRSVITGNPGSYGPGGWAACQARNTGGGTVVDDQGLYCFDVSVPNDNSSGVDSKDYTTRVAASNFVPGGALYNYFSASPTATTPSPSQSRTVVEGGGNVMTYDYGYRIPPPATAPGTGTVGYWKNHPNAWPVSSITIGGVTYTKAQAIELMGEPVRGDITIQLAHQLIAAKLNVLVGNASSCIAGNISAADSYLLANPVGSKPKGGAKTSGDNLKDTLDQYNNGNLCAPHRD